MILSSSTSSISSINNVINIVLSECSPGARTLLPATGVSDHSRAAPGPGPPFAPGHTGHPNPTPDLFKKSNMLVCILDYKCYMGIFMFCCFKLIRLPYLTKRKHKADLR